ncbi:HNH endonuclease [Rhizobium sp. Root483D2]|uniref:HNH endonuclease n=1 Tax=Rhizobium sp. Root483D2 TaxID=1736545 RepID=UPI001FCD2E2D|nr:HNH endonuclease [Rhizobium sp. Root483D2]
MPVRAPSVCGHCGKAHPQGDTCATVERLQRERKARFDKKRPSARQRGYTAEWVRESKAFLKANPLCGRCEQPATLVHHLTAHKGNQRLFWNRLNWAARCAHCHNSAEQAKERKPS